MTRTMYTPVKYSPAIGYPRTRTQETAGQTPVRTPAAAQPENQDLQGINTSGLAYTQLSEDAIVRQAQSQADAAYGTRKQAAQDAYESGELAFDRQLSDMDDSYGRQMEQAKAQADQTVSAVDRSALSRGMQRSSYNLATLSNARLAGDETLRGIGEARTRAEGGIASERALKAQQFARELQQAQIEYENNILLNADKLREREYQRAFDATVAQNELMMELAKYKSQLAAQQAEQRRWQIEFDEGVRRYNREHPYWNNAFAQTDEVLQYPVQKVTKIGKGV